MGQTQHNVQVGLPDFDREWANFLPRQQTAVDLLDTGVVKFLLYGGAMGGGKSRFLRWYGIRRLIMLSKWGFRHAAGMLACEDYPSLKDRQLVKIAFEFPRWLGKMHEDHKVYGRCFLLTEYWGGGALCFRNLDDPSKYASSEWAFTLIDELTKNSVDMFDNLRNRLRWPGLRDLDCQFVGATNPGGIGHGWVKALWIDHLFDESWTTSEIDYRPHFAFVPAKADDNPHLDEGYWAALSTLPPALKKAYRDGSWEVFIGQAFPEFQRPTHVIRPLPVPDNASLYMTYDWGFGKPFHIGWWWVDGDGRLYLCNEWYGFTGKPDEGLRLTDPEVADGVIAREKAMGISGRTILRLAGHDSFSKKPDLKGGGQGKSTFEEFAEKGIYLVKGDPDRKLKIRQVHERFRVLPDARPMLLVYNTCEQFIRTVSDLVVDKNNIEDVDTKGEDHAYDGAALICMARPLAIEAPKKAVSYYDARIDRLERGDRGSWEHFAEREQIETMRDMGLSTVGVGGFDDAEWPEGYVDQDDANEDLVPTIGTRGSGW